MTTNLFVIANVKQLRTDASFRILVPFFRTSWGVGILNSAVFNSFHNWVEFGMILEGLWNLGGCWTPLPSSTPLSVSDPNDLCIHNYWPLIILYVFVPLRYWIDVDILAFTAAVRNLIYGKGSLIPLRKFEVQGIIKKSSRGRVVFPPVRYWLGKLVALSVLFLLCYTMWKIKICATDMTIYVQTYIDIHHTPITSWSYWIGFIVFSEIVGWLPFLLLPFFWMKITICKCFGYFFS